MLFKVEGIFMDLLHIFSQWFTRYIWICVCLLDVDLFSFQAEGQAKYRKGG